MISGCYVRTRKSSMLKLALVLLAVGVLVMAGGTAASNMGFKVVCELKGVGPQSNSGTSFIGLPYFPKEGIATARDLFVDIGGSIQAITRHNKSQDNWIVYTYGGGHVPPNGWSLVPGEGLIVKVGSDLSYTIIGSHDDSAVVNLTGYAPGISANGMNLVAVPYHTTAANARELFDEIGGSIQLISRHRKDDDAYDVYTYGGGSLPPDGWDLRRGESYFIKVGSNMSWHPLHY